LGVDDLEFGCRVIEVECILMLGFVTVIDFDNDGALMFGTGAL